MIADSNTEMLAHTGPDGFVYYVVLGKTSTSSCVSVEGVGDACRRYGVNVIRMIGCRANVCLIHWAHANRCRYGVMQGGPRRIVTAASTSGVQSCSDPESILIWLWQAMCRKAMTTWHTIGGSEHAAYALAAEFISSRGRFNDKMSHIMKYHPAWPALSFMSIKPDPAACRLLAAIGDPRWFMDVMKPGSCSRLLAYMGLTPRNLQAWMNEKDGDERTQRAKLVMEAWKASKPEGGDFLRQILLSRSEPVNGLVAASRRFLMFVQRVWLNDPFDPSMFFSDPHERARWMGHQTFLTVGYKR